MFLVRAYGVRFTLAIGIDQIDGDEVGVWDTVCICDSQRIFQNLLDGTPNIDNLVSSGEELVGDLRKMKRHSGFGSSVRLVDVNARHRATKRLSCRPDVFLRPANRVVEDEDARGSGTS